MKNQLYKKYILKNSFIHMKFKKARLIYGVCCQHGDYLWGGGLK